MTVRLIGSEIYRRSTYGGKHPLAIPRVSAALDLIRAMGWLDERDYLDSPMATPAELARFHAADYIAAVQRAERDQDLPAAERERYQIGVRGNPIYREVFRRPATACGGSLLAARLIADGEAEAVYNIAGGTHHGRPDHASGFCYFNDPVLCILALLDRGVRRVFYVDVDAHHGDGVQDAFADDARVFTLSIHEHGRWPGTGAAEDRAAGAARNIPVPAGFNDSELAYIRETAAVPLLTAFAPEVVVMQGGADALDDDPMSRLSLSNRALWAFAARMRPLAPRFILLGGGGYNPWALARCWAGMWATLAGFDPAAAPTFAAQTVLGSLSWSRRPGQPVPERLVQTLADPCRDEAVRDAVRHTVDTAMADGLGGRDATTPHGERQVAARVAAERAFAAHR